MYYYLLVMIKKSNNILTQVILVGNTVINLKTNIK